MWNIHSHYHPPPYMKEEPVGGDVGGPQHLWERDDGMNVPVVEPVVEIKTGADYIEGPNSGIMCDPHDQGVRHMYPYSSLGELFVCYDRNYLLLLIIPSRYIGICPYVRSFVRVPMASPLYRLHILHTCSQTSSLV